ncbi:MAG: CopG family transcriptional regulator [Acidobacteriota bacterium]
MTLTDDLAQLADREIRRRRVSMSALVREALASYLGVGGEAKRKLPFAALGASGHHDTARNMEAILDAEWSPTGDR